MKKAIVVVSFGTTYEQARKAIFKIEDQMKKAFPDYDFYRAFTSSIIIKMMKEKQGIVIETPEELMRRLKEEGYGEIICQPTHVIPGYEYDKMREMLLPFQSVFQKLRVGKPLLYTEEDYESCARIIMDEIPERTEKEGVVFMGHGTKHYVNGAYAQMENMLRSQGNENVYVGTVEGFPGIEYVCDRLKKKEIEKTYLMPFMVVAGDHARNDLAGEEGNSWKKILQSKGIKTEVLLKGLGEIDEVGDLFIKHAKEAEELV